MIVGDKMSYQSLYRKYRPTQFEEIVGQQATVKIIKNAIKKEKIAHAYLFCGPRGTGKTSMAKLLAQAVNCTDMHGDVCNKCDNCVEERQGNHPDIVEIDAASNNGVDEIRELISKVKYTPILGKYKVYIIDEVHMLSQGAFNALLKTLEEPPSHVIFVLATTEVHKVIPTIVSRCQRFDFTRINDQKIADHLINILNQEDIDYEKGVSEVIARLSGGGIRNALTILEQSIVYSDDKILIQDVYDVTGLISNQDKIELIRPIKTKKLEETLEKTKESLSKSHSASQLTGDIIRALKDSIILKTTGNKDIVSYEHLEFVDYLSENLSLNQTYTIMDVLLEYSNKMKFSQNQNVYFEIAMIKAFNEVNNRQQDPIEPITLDDRVEPAVVQTKQSKVKNTSVKKEIKPKRQVKQTNNVPRETIDKKPEEVLGNPTTATPKDVSHETKTTNNIKQDIESNVELMTKDKIIELMVSGDKEKRINDEEKIEKLVSYKNNIKWAKTARMLEKAELVISSQHFLVFAFHNDSLARESMVQPNKNDIINFIEVLTKEKRVVLSTTRKDFKEAIEIFRELAQKKKLPKPLPKEEFILTKEKEISTNPVIENAKKLFGDKLVVKE